MPGLRAYWYGFCALQTLAVWLEWALGRRHGFPDVVFEQDALDLAEKGESAYRAV
jgi:hypothetical protein